MSTDPTQDRPSCMGVMDRALALERAGDDVVHLEKGEPDFPTPEPIVEAAVRALRDGHTSYTSSAGLLELREAICGYYQRVHGVAVAPSQVVVNAGSSPALLTALLAVLVPGDEVVVPNPGYPSYRRLVELAGAKPVPVATAGQGFRYTAEAAAELVGPTTRAIIVNFPSNPVGATAGLAALQAFTRLGPLVIADEVYQGLSYGPGIDPSILRVTGDAVVVNSFSKAFAMTGWRLGYAILPPDLVSQVAPIHQDAFISPNAFVQRAGIEALGRAEQIMRGWRDELRARRDLLLAGLAATGFEVPYPPEGAFYVFAKLPPGHHDSYAFAARLLERARVAVTPGAEFGSDGEGYLRLSYATAPPRITEGIDRIRRFLDQHS